MSGALAHLRDRLLGRGDAAITVPVFDGALKSNRLLEDAELLSELEAPQDLATDGEQLFVADGERVLAYSPGGHLREYLRAPAPITALTCVAGGLALALDGSELRVFGGRHDGLRWSAAAKRPLRSLNALATYGDRRLVATEGSQHNACDAWKRDLMTLGCSGRVIAFDLYGAKDGERATELACGLHHPFGVCAIENTLWFSESWRHRVHHLNAGTDPLPLLDRLAAYPSRLAQATGGGAWLSCFLPRTQLVEFVLREDAYRRRMVDEIDPAYWIAPALSSGHSFLEPMQGAQLKVMGVVKPWAPPRSYGLVVRLDGQGQPRYSLHSRFDGRHHGVVALAELAGSLYVLAKGAGRVLRLDIAQTEGALQL